MLSLVPGVGGDPTFLLTAAGLLIAWSVAERRTTARLPAPLARAADLLVATSILGVAVLHVTMENASLLTVGHVLAISQLARAFRRKRPMDLVVMNGTATGQTALAAFLTRDPLFLPVLLVTVILAVHASVRVALLGAPESGEVRIFTARPRGSAGLRARLGRWAEPGVLTVAVLVVGGFFFVVLPRGKPFLDGDGRPAVSYEGSWSEVRSGRASDAGTSHQTGFSDRVSLGEVGRIKENQREAFTVRISEGLRAFRTQNALRFRAVVFDTFDGREWRREVQPAGGERWLTTDIRPARIPVRNSAGGRVAGTRVLRQEYRMQATFARSLPAVGSVLNVRLDEELPKVLLMNGGTFASPRGLPNDGLTYEVTSLVSLRENRPALAEALTEQEARICLTVPPGMTRLTMLAKEIAPDGHPLDKAAKIKSWLQANCEYTLRFRPWPTGRPLHDFVFVTHAGHCEYFATAQAIMLRAVGVPSRMVAGYRGGLWIEHLESYFVRMSEAHAWVEAYVPGRGWVTLDPTPGDGAAVNVPGSRVPVEGVETDEPLEERIATIVTDFGPKEREKALSAVTVGVEFVFREGFGLGRPPRSFPPPLTVIFGAGILTLLAFRLFSQRLGRRRANGRAHANRRTIAPPDSPFYDAAIRVLARAGMVRRSNQSAREFLDETRRRRPDATAPFRDITLTFEGVRYGHEALREEDLEEMRRLVARLEEGLKPVSG
jgi:transglutaminase-like putative cysteine protease